MPMFAFLETEAKVQENDKTRLKADQSFVAGVAALSTMTIRPSRNASAVDCFADQYLDWKYSFAIDVVSGENHKLDFKEGSGPELTATLTVGEKTLAQLAADIKTKMEAVGALTYTVTVSDENEITIAADGAFSLLGGSGTNAAVGILASIGFPDDLTDGETTYTGSKIETIDRIATLSINNATTPVTLDKTIQVVSEIADNLFSTDDQLRKHEPEIMKYLPAGRATFIDVHRRAQALILAIIDTEGFLDDYGDKLTVEDFVDTSEVSEWSAALTLQLIFEGVANAPDDIFSEKAKRYAGLALLFKRRAILRVDTNADGIVDPSTNEGLFISDMRVSRR